MGISASEPCPIPILRALVSTIQTNGTVLSSHCATVEQPLPHLCLFIPFPSQALWTLTPH